MRPIDKAIEASGGQAELARRIGVSLQAVYQWHKGTRPVPPGRCIPIEQATGGAITRYELRRDVFGDPPSSEDAA